ncbi:MAG: hypothetical protein JNL79_23085 [Myxococcales bacterium]|nr:hypothetical protein [Myxococcales bacterium]
MNARVLLLGSLLSLAACSGTSDPEPMTLEQAQTGFAGTYAGTFTGDGKSGSIEIALSLTASVTPKCGTHTLSTKCIDVTNIRVVGTLTTADGSFTKTAVEGTVTVYGVTTDNGGDLTLRTTAGDTVQGSLRKNTASGTVKLTTGKSFTFDAPRK